MFDCFADCDKVISSTIAPLLYARPALSVDEVLSAKGIERDLLVSVMVEHAARKTGLKMQAVSRDGNELSGALSLSQ